MFAKRWIKRGGKGIAVGTVGAIAITALIDNWLPYALLSHHNRAVDAYPQLFETYSVLAQTITFDTPTYASTSQHPTPNTQRSTLNPQPKSQIESEDTLQIQGWFIPGEMSNRTVIILHGLGATRQDMLEFGLPLQQAGYNLALIDLRSHGDSGGEFFTYGYHEWQDVVSLLDSLEQEVPEAIEDVTLIGVSVGGAIAIPATAQDSRIDRLITVSTFADLEMIIKAQTTLLPDFWRQRAIATAERLANFEVAATIPKQAIQEVDVPVLIIHGESDGYIPLENGQALYAAANHPKQFYKMLGADHGDILSHSPTQLNQVILDFMSTDRYLR